MLLSSLQFCRNNSITFTVHTQLFLKDKYQQLDENTGKNVGLMLKSTCYFSYEYNKSSESQFSHFYISRASAVICWIQNNRCTSPQLVLLFKRFQEIVLYMDNASSPPSGQHVVLFPLPIPFSFCGFLRYDNKNMMLYIRGFVFWVNSCWNWIFLSVKTPM